MDSNFADRLVSTVEITVEPRSVHISNEYLRRTLTGDRAGTHVAFVRSFSVSRQEVWSCRVDARTLAEAGYPVVINESSRSVSLPEGGRLLFVSPQSHSDLLNLQGIVCKAAYFEECHPDMRAMIYRWSKVFVR